jgi:hypothetical protein
MNDSSATIPVARSWRDIPQEVKPRAMSKSGRRRHLLAVAKLVGGTLLAGGLIWATVEIVTTIENNPRELAKAAQSGPVREPELVTDGVLDKAWLARALALPKGTTLVELDLNRLQAKLLANPQVLSAVFTKTFPDKLTVAITERAPVARMEVEGWGEQLVARDGVLFAGEGYERDTLDRLPWLDLGDARLVRRGAGFAPINGMDAVSLLLDEAKRDAPHLFPTFKIVSLARLATDGLIEVRTPEIQSIIFTTRDDFYRQLAKLDKVRDTWRPTAETPMAKIDLSLGKEVPVKLGALAGSPTAPAATPGSAGGASKPAVFAFPQFQQRKSSSREL